MSEYVKRHTSKILCHINALHCTLCDVQYVAIKRAYMLRHLKIMHKVEYTHLAAAHDGDMALIMAHMTSSRVIVSNSTRCNICDIVLHSQCVSNLCRHLRIKHPETCDAEWVPVKRVHKPRVPRRSPHMALVQLLRTMHWPTDVVEAPAFVHFVATVAPKYVLPRKEVCTYKYNTACVLYFFGVLHCVCVFPQELQQYFTTDSVQDAPLDLSC
ncbi:hypothetical protein [Three spot gourami iridovirus]|nr:hypothetical protein [South American cichlid iridovirus]AVR29882.1 hypothetical protein [Three spot gourami iridovirus]